MKYYIVVDCGTTNSRAYVVDEKCRVYASARNSVGVRNVSTSGDKKPLEEGLREIVDSAIGQSGIAKEKITAVISSGMITSEIGLFEIPHATAPVSICDMAKSLTCIDLELLPGKKLHLVRGIKNPVPESMPLSETVGCLDFMRGEEVQIAGLISAGIVELPITVVILSSHTKYVPIDRRGAILGSLTTMSGQLFDVISNGTFLAKSLKPDENETQCANYSEQIVDDAYSLCKRVGINRAVMFPRFMDVLLNSKWYERRLFLEAIIAAEDMAVLPELDKMYHQGLENLLIVGNDERCRVYEHLLSRELPHTRIRHISNQEQIDMLQISGAVAIATMAGI